MSFLFNISPSWHKISRRNNKFQWRKQCMWQSKQQKQTFICTESRLYFKSFSKLSFFSNVCHNGGVEILPWDFFIIDCARQINKGHFITAQHTHNALLCDNSSGSGKKFLMLEKGWSLSWKTEDTLCLYKMFEITRIKNLITFFSNKKNAQVPYEPVR